MEESNLQCAEAENALLRAEAPTPQHVHHLNNALFSSRPHTEFPDLRKSGCSNTIR